MTIEILNIGQLETFLSKYLCDGLSRAFPGESCRTVVEKNFPLKKSYDEKRRQYSSGTILLLIQALSSRTKLVNRFLGVVHVDLFAPGLSFVFGEAAFPGKVALISSLRLRPEFYSQPPDLNVFYERCLKEAVHEIGHTFGLRHCPRVTCVMHFSNSISDTDRKRTLLCDKCSSQLVSKTYVN